MSDQIKLPFFTLLLLISFASVNAVLFTPALPNIVNFFHISASISQQTITWFLIGYASGQLIYGPLANRFGRKPALYAGISIQILSSLLCVFSGVIHYFSLLVIARFFLALGAGVGLKITFTLVNECLEPKKASQKISHLILAFAITPGLSVTLGGILNTYFNWQSCFYAGAIYGCILLILSTQIPETKKKLDYQALNIRHLLFNYSKQFQNRDLILGGILMGLSTSFIYVFAAITPFIAISLFHMSSFDYGLANLLPSVGLFLGSLTSARLSTTLTKSIKKGIQISAFGVVLMFLAFLLNLPSIIFLFVTTIVIYFGLCFILANASSLAMHHAEDKAYGSAVMSFLNMGTATILTLFTGLISISPSLLPIIFALLCVSTMIIYTAASRRV